jgi:hypothetical protein
VRIALEQGITIPFQHALAHDHHHNECHDERRADEDEGKPSHPDLGVPPCASERLLQNATLPLQLATIARLIR